MAFAALIPCCSPPTQVIKHHLPRDVRGYHLGRSPAQAVIRLLQVVVTALVAWMRVQARADTVWVDADLISKSIALS